MVPQPERGGALVGETGADADSAAETGGRVAAGNIAAMFVAELLTHGESLDGTNEAARDLPNDLTQILFSFAPMRTERSEGRDDQSTQRLAHGPELNEVACELGRVSEEVDFILHGLDAVVPRHHRSATGVERAPVALR